MVNWIPVDFPTFQVISSRSYFQISKSCRHSICDDDWRGQVCNINLNWRPTLIGPILLGHSGPLCHALSLLLLLLLLWTSILHCHSPGVATVARVRLRYSYSWLWLILVVVSTVATPGEWQCKIRTGGMRRLAVANETNIFSNASCLSHSANRVV